MTIRLHQIPIFAAISTEIERQGAEQGTPRVLNCMTTDLFPPDSVAEGVRPPALSDPLDKNHYLTECAQRWHGPALADAQRNWIHWQRWRPVLTQHLINFRRDPWLKSEGETCANRDGTLTGYIWELQKIVQPDPARIDPFIDFEDRYQKCFLRRGLVIYCTMILRLLESLPTSES